jgi:hypothetical protein
MAFAFLLLISVVTLLVDWPWRSRVARGVGATLRVLLTLVLAFLLYWDVGMGVGRAWRRAMIATDPVTSEPPAFPSFTPYQSGVTTMRREASRDAESIAPFVWALVIIGVVPVFRLLLPRSGDVRPPVAGQSNRELHDGAT